MRWTSEFIEDYSKLSLEEFENKYSRRIPKTITVSEILQTAKNERTLNTFIDTVWYGDKRDKKAHFLLKTDQNKFQVFVSERGSKHWLTTHSDLESAIANKIDLILNDLGFSASDTKIK